MAIEAKTTLDVEELIAVADAGYYESDQLKQCEDQQITAHVPVPTVPSILRTTRGRDLSYCFYSNNIPITHDIGCKRRKCMYVGVKRFSKRLPLSLNNY